MAAAHFDDDFALRDPPRKKAVRRPAGKGRKQAGRWAALKLDPKLLAKRAAIGASLLVALGIVVNALELQKGRHPAPLFGTSVTLVEDAPRAKPVPVPVPVSRPAPQKAAALPDPDADAPASDAPAPDAPSPDPAPARHAETARPAPAHAAGVDEIARLLQHGPAPRPARAAEPPAARPLAAHPAPPAPAPTPRTVYNVQQALVKLGFVLKPNGVYGPQTRKALALFGKDRHLPVGSTLSPRVIKILAAESGLRIEHP